jgi:cleavage and polyadenylation specificity factor subunit 1
MTDTGHISGQDNIVADTLSRVESFSAPLPYDTLATSQNSDGELQTLMGSTIALQLKKLPTPGTTLSMYYDTSAGRSQPYIPVLLRLQVLQSIHDMSHPGTKATAKLVAQRLAWPGMQKD